jgi:hypothetical protein
MANYGIDLAPLMPDIRADKLSGRWLPLGFSQVVFGITLTGMSTFGTVAVNDASRRSDGSVDPGLSGYQAHLG